jgi:hypothetical protein
LGMKAPAVRLGLLFEPLSRHPTPRPIVPVMASHVGFVGAHGAVGGRVFGLNVSDWSMLLGGVALISLLALLI